MKRKYIDRSKWEKIEKSKCVLFNTFQERFKGYASAIFIEKYDDLYLDVVVFPSGEIVLVNENQTNK